MQTANLFLTEIVVIITMSINRSSNGSSSSSSTTTRRNALITSSRSCRASTSSSRSEGSSQTTSRSSITSHVVKCTICSERYKVADRIYGGSCGHVFHWQCLQRWWEESSRCPICRSAVQDFHQIYLDFEDSVEQGSEAGQESTSSSGSQEYGQTEYANLLYEAHLYRDEIDYLNTRIEMYRYQIKLLNTQLDQLTLSDSD